MEINSFLFLKVHALETQDRIHASQLLFIPFWLLYIMNAVRYLSLKMTVEVMKEERGEARGGTVSKIGISVLRNEKFPNKGNEI